MLLLEDEILLNFLDVQDLADECTSAAAVGTRSWNFFGMLEFLWLFAVLLMYKSITSVDFCGTCWQKRGIPVMSGT